MTDPADTVRQKLTGEVQRTERCPELGPCLYLNQVVKKYSSQVSPVSSLTLTREQVAMSDRQSGYADGEKGRGHGCSQQPTAPLQLKMELPCPQSTDATGSNPIYINHTNH